MKRLIKKSKRVFLKDILKQWELDLNDPDDSMVYDTDYYNRDCAFMIFNGKVYEGETHDNLLATYDVYNISNNSYSLILGSVLTGTDNNRYVAIYPGSAYNMTVQDAIPILKQKYSNAIITIDEMTSINDDAYLEVIGKLIKNKKLIKKY